MDERDIFRVFDQTRPTSEQKEAMLDRLLGLDKEEKPVKHVKRMLVFGIAAALMVITCAAAVVTGIDRRLVEYFGAGPEQEEWLAAAIAAEGPVTHTFESGWTIQVGQVLADRYQVSVVMDFTAPENIDLAAIVKREGEGEFELLMDFSVEDREGNVLNTQTLLPNGIAEITAGNEQALQQYEAWERYMYGPGSKKVTLLEGTNLEQGRISLLCTFNNGMEPDEVEIKDELLGGRLRLAPKGLWFPEARKVLYFRGEAQAWNYEVTLPEKDPGRFYTINQPVVIDSCEMELQKVYLSPIGLSYDVYYDQWGKKLCTFPNHLEDYALSLSDGSTLAMTDGPKIHSTGEAGVEYSWEFYHIDLKPERLIDPDKVVSFTLFGQTFELK